jgi:hypothetical protein
LVSGPKKCGIAFWAFDPPDLDGSGASAQTFLKKTFF